MRPRSTSMVRMAWYCGSMPCTVSEAALKALLIEHAVALDLGADHRDQARLARQRPRVVDGEQDPAAGAFAASLHRRPAAPDDGDVLAQLLEHVLVAALEALAGGRQDHHRHDAPEIPNIVRKLRSLLARRFWKTWTRTSQAAHPAALAREDDAVPGLQAAE